MTYRMPKSPSKATTAVAVLCALVVAPLQVTLTPRDSPKVRALAQARSVSIDWMARSVSIDWMAQAQAQAAVNSTLAVLVIPVQRKNADDAEALERLLSDAVHRLDAVRLYDLSPVPGAEAGQQAAGLVEEALRALLLRTPKRAQERLAAAIQLLADNPMAGDERLYARLYKAQGLTWLANNEVVRGRDGVQKSLVMFPGQTAEEYAAYGSIALELFDNVKAGMAEAPTGDFKVVIKGGKADIWVDGVHRGNGLVSVPDLVVGTHRVSVKASGMVAERRFVDVTAGKTVVAEFDLKPATFGTDLDQGRNVLVANFSQPSVVEDRIRELRNQLGADQMMVVRPKLNKKNTEMTGYFLGADGSFKKVDVVLDKDEKYLDKMAEFVSAAVGSKLLPDPNSQPLDQRQSVVQTGAARTADNTALDMSKPIFDEDKTTEEPITKKWWFWALVAGGAGAVGGGLYLLLGGEGPPPLGATGTIKVNLYKASGN